MNISIFGLGYVGTVCAGCLAAEGHAVVGVDIDTAKVASVNDGVGPIAEPGISTLIQKGHTSKTLWATASAREAIEASEISLVCVGTPSQMNGCSNLTYMTRVCAEIGTALQNGHGAHLLVFRSTLPPGTVEDLLIPILEQHSGKKVGDGLAVCYNPEFLREGTAVRDFYNPPKIVLGELDARDGAPLLQLYSGIKAPVIRTSIRVAEMVKYADNAFHALKISFANEIGNLCKSLGIDGHEVMEIFCQDTKLNLSSAYLKPGFAFGGSCLPKDLRALAWLAKKLDLESPVLNAILQSNSSQIKMAIEKILGLGKKRVGVLGVAFKPNTDDLRESPLVAVIEALIGKGHCVRIYDPYVSTARLVGANKRFIDEHLAHLSCLLVDSLEALVDTSEVIVIGYQTPEFERALQLLRPDQTVIDLVRIAKEIKTRASYDGMCW